MDRLSFSIKKPLSYDMTGKFSAPSEDWMHTNEYKLLNYELIIPTKNTLYLTYANENHVIETGSYILLAPLANLLNERKGFKASLCSFYWLHFDAPRDSTLKETSDQFSARDTAAIADNRISIPVKGELKNLDRLIILMKQLQDAVKEKYPKKCLDYLTTSILCELFFQMNQKELLSNPDKRSKKQIYFDILEYIRLNVREPLSVKRIAAIFNYNESYLSSSFKKLGGTSLKKVILDYKIEEASLLLVDTNKNVSEIADELSFYNPQHFTKAFKKHTGLTPTAYRNAYSQRLLYNK